MNGHKHVSRTRLLIRAESALVVKPTLNNLFALLQHLQRSAWISIRLNRKPGAKDDVHSPVFPVHHAQKWVRGAPGVARPSKPWGWSDGKI
jgi:hypothetical protein